MHRPVVSVNWKRYSPSCPPPARLFPVVVLTLFPPSSKSDTVLPFKLASVAPMSGRRVPDAVLRYTQRVINEPSVRLSRGSVKLTSPDAVRTCESRRIRESSICVDKKIIIESILIWDGCLITHIKTHCHDSSVTTDLVYLPRTLESISKPREVHQLY